jgi:DNA-binding PadR family transcriptional regulator
MALAVLTVVLERPMHPYEMALVLRSRGKDQDMPIKWGSLYTVVRNMEKHGLLEAVESMRQGGRPERTIYRITDAGREELDDWTREVISTPEPEHPRFEAGLSVMGALGPDEVMSLLWRRLRLLDEEIARHSRWRGIAATYRAFSSSRWSTGSPSSRPRRPGSARCWRSSQRARFPASRSGAPGARRARYRRS